MSEEKQDFLRRWSRLKKEAAAAPAAAGKETVEPPVELPALDSLTFESDFKAFMGAKVEQSVKRAALKKLFADPRFNVMDGLDVYIDDYSKPDPLPEGWLEKMNQVKHLGIFKPPDEEAEAPAAPRAEPLQKAMSEQPLAEVAEAPPADTSAEEIPPSGVGKAGVPGQGV
jgi:hypothetical protein